VVEVEHAQVEHGDARTADGEGAADVQVAAGAAGVGARIGIGDERGVGRAGKRNEGERATASRRGVFISWSLKKVV
jgi:hypothetical protein